MPVETGVLVHKISDLMATFTAVNFNIRNNNSNSKRIKFRSFRIRGPVIDGFKNELCTVNWDSVFDTSPNTK